MGEWTYKSKFSWHQHLLDVSGELNDLATLPPGKESQVSLDRILGGPLPGQELRPFGRPASSYSDCAVPAPPYSRVAQVKSVMSL
jgi:hypothetical protein